MKLAEKLVTHYGGRAQAAAAINVNKETIRLWLRDGIPLERALDVEEKSKGVVKAEEVLREARTRKRTEAAPA